jgi:hypothetical protein
MGLLVSNLETPPSIAFPDEVAKHPENPQNDEPKMMMKLHTYECVCMCTQVCVHTPGTCVPPGSG